MARSCLNSWLFAQAGHKYESTRLQDDQRKPLKQNKATWDQKMLFQ